MTTHTYHPSGASPRRNPDVGPLGDLFALVVLVASTGAFLPWMQGFEQDLGGGGNQTTIAMWAVFYLVAAALLGRELPTVVGRSTRERFLWGVVLWAGLSALWSLDPALTARRSLALAGTSLIGLQLAATYSIRDMVRLICLALLIVMAASLFAGQLDIGIDPRHPRSGALRGVFESKNLLAQVLVFGLPAFAVQIGSKSRAWQALGVVGLLASAVMIYLSDSATGFVTAPLALGALVACYLAPRYPRKAFGVGLVLVALGLVQVFLVGNRLMTIDAEGVFDALDRDPTMTGRTDIWALSWLKILQRPVFGYGHGAFWTGPDGPGSGTIARFFGQDPGYAHNGFLDALLGFGFVGLALLLGAMAVAFGLASRFVRETSGWVAAFPLAFLAVLVLGNLTEGGLVEQNHYMWLMLVAITVRLRWELPVKR